MQTQRVLSITFHVGLLILVVGMLRVGSSVQAQASDPNRCVEILEYGMGYRRFIDTQTSQGYTVLQEMNFQALYVSPDGSTTARLDASPNAYRLLLFSEDAVPQTIHFDSLNDWTLIPVHDRLIWSPDSSSFAYFWPTSTGQGTVSLYSVDNASEQSIAFTTPNPDTLRMIGWSHDGRYFALSDSVDTYITRYTFLTALPLAFHTQRLPLGQYSAGVWSPTRSEFATLKAVDDQHVELRITPMDGEPTVTQFAASPQSALTWSATGNELVVTSALQPWTYQLFQRNDMSMRGNSRGSTTALWSADGTRLYWLGLPDGNASYSLEMLEVATDTTETLIRGIRAEDSAYIWATAMLNGHFTTRTTAAPPQSDTLIVPHRATDGFNFSIVDTDIGSVQNILTGLASLDPIGNLNFSFAPDGMRFYVLTSTAEPNTITLINLDTLTTASYTATDAESINSVRWSDPYHIAFAAHAGQRTRITSLDVRTMTSVVWGETNSSEWSLSFSPTDPALAAFQTRIDFQQGSLLLKRENEETVFLLSEYAPYRPVWSADGTRLAFDDYSSGQREIVVANNVGDILTRTPILQDGEYGIIGFTDCSL